MMVLLGSIMAMGKLDLESKVGTEVLRLCFVISSMYCAAAYYWVYTVIGEKKDQTKVFVKPAKDGAPAVIVSKHDYDMERLGEMIRSYLMWVIMIGFLHFQTDASKPMFLTAMLNPSQATENALFRIHVMGEDDRIEDLERPWAPESLLTNLGLIQKPRRKPQAVPGPSVTDGAPPAAGAGASAPAVQAVAPAAESS